MEICFRSEISGCKIVLKVKSLCATEGRRVDIKERGEATRFSELLHHTVLRILRRRPCNFEKIALSLSNPTQSFAHISLLTRSLWFT